MVIRNFLLSMAIEFGPTILFFIGAVVYDFYTGVWFLLVGVILSLIVSYLRDGRLPLFALIVSGFVLVSGGLTIFTSQPYWIVLEYTLYNLAFSLAIFVGYLKNKSILKVLFNSMFQMTDLGWQRLSVRWGFFFLIAAIGSEYFWRIHGEEAWIYYRLLMSVVLAIFGISQFFLVRANRLPEASPWGLRVYDKDHPFS